MRTFSWEGEAFNEDGSLPGMETQKAEVHIHHHGNYSANVRISVPTRVGQPETYEPRYERDEAYSSLYVPFEALRALVLNKLREDKIAALEQMTEAEIERDIKL